MKVSFFELWLVVHDDPKNNIIKLQRLLNTMGINDVDPTEYGIYKGLCEWKNKEHDDQMSLLRDELCAANLADVWEHTNGKDVPCKNIYFVVTERFDKIKFEKK